MNSRPPFPRMALPALCAAVAAAAAVPLSAQTTAAVIGSGAVASANSHTMLSATLGQPVIGRAAAQSTGESTGASQGFWHAPKPASAASAGEAAVSSSLHLSTVPNPFSRSTTLSFTLREGGTVSLVLYNGIGQQVRTLLSGEREAGTISAAADLSELPSGSYTAVLRVGKMRASVRLLLTD